MNYEREVKITKELEKFTREVKKHLVEERGVDYDKIKEEKLHTVVSHFLKLHRKKRGDGSGYSADKFIHDSLYGAHGSKKGVLDIFGLSHKNKQIVDYHNLFLVASPDVTNDYIPESISKFSGITKVDKSRINANVLRFAIVEIIIDYKFRVKRAKNPKKIIKEIIGNLSVDELCFFGFIRRKDE